MGIVIVYIKHKSAIFGFLLFYIKQKSYIYLCRYPDIEPLNCVLYCLLYDRYLRMYKIFIFIFYFYHFRQIAFFLLQVVPTHIFLHKQYNCFYVCLNVPNISSYNKYNKSSSCDHKIYKNAKCQKGEYFKLVSFNNRVC